MHKDHFFHPSDQIHSLTFHYRVSIRRICVRFLLLSSN